MQIFLLEQFEGAGHFEQPNGPLLPPLCFSFVIFLATFEQVPAPRAADECGIAPQGRYELLVLDEMGPLFKSNLILVPVAGRLIVGEGPPVVMRVVKGGVFFDLVPPPE